MPVTVNWLDDDENITLMTFEGDWTFEELRDAMNREAEMIAVKVHMVDSIGDFTTSGGLPRNLLGNLPRLGPKRSTNQGYSVLVGVTNRLFQDIGGIVHRLYRRLEFKDTLEEGVAFLREARENPISS
jgi:hypothetical protein